ncbi:hypothetical protein L218DRAFT_651984 [Marasmius fiardii PR-910]|nr:hypothetical protein L218DRAFT_651984 [Marasmius fiardii PR-910]
MPPKRRSLHLVGASSSANATLQGSGGAQRKLKAEITEIKTLNTIYRDHCVQCGRSPVIEEFNNRRLLTDILAAVDLSSIAPALKAFGIYHDGHLYLLNVLSPTERRDVLRGVPNVTAIDTYALIKDLENRTAGRDHTDVSTLFLSTLYNQQRHQ